MGISVLITENFEHMSDVAARVVKNHIIRTLEAKNSYVIGLATGASPTGLYKKLAQSANAGEFDPGKIQSFNLDAYVGLPGETPQDRVMHPESYCFFMIREFFGLLNRAFSRTSLPCGSMIDQERLVKELSRHPEDWTWKGTNAGKAVSIREDAASKYLSWIRKSILEGYRRRIEDAGGIDLQVIGVGGRGHAGFHESGIPFDSGPVLLVKLDENTIENAVADRHFNSKNESPCYAVSMGAELIYRARTVVLLASGERKRHPVALSLLERPTAEIPISYGRIYGRNGGEMIYIIDKSAAEELLAGRDVLKRKQVEIHEVPT
ncbi:MAG TPA: 6-phosphogluconolactonase [Desulfobacteraceae bacterium]|nr:6-phosphogluconolactonase [Desulfobacteraceae bacterium]